MAIYKLDRRNGSFKKIMCKNEFFSYNIYTVSLQVESGRVVYANFILRY